MEPSDPTPPSYESPLPERLLSRLAGLPGLFTRPTWQNVLLLVAGAILAPGKRTVTAALRILGREQDNDFPIYHSVLNRAVWSSRAVAGWLLRLLVGTFVGADATVVIGIDDTIERRWGHKINARGIYRDPVRSSKGHFVKTSGLRWLSAQLLVHIPWAGRIMGLPLLTVLAPSKRFYDGKPRSAKTLLDCARQVALQIHRWLPGRRIVIVGDTAFAAIEFLGAVRNYVSVATRLRLDANLYAPAPPRRGRRCTMPARFGNATLLLSGTAAPIMWSRSPPVPPFGTGAACLRCRFAGCWYAIRTASFRRKPSSAPTATPPPSIFCNGSSRAGSWRSPFRKAVPISASKPSGSGPTWRSCAPPRRCLAYSRW
ncbi:transposase [Acidiphilium multivorum]|uniref:IS701 family transposase n=1 Tax=Acidiphilium multivorum TaxID=62140 RepID=UPI0039C9AA93